MPDVPSSALDLHAIFHQRKNAWAGIHADQDELIDVYNGILPPKFKDYFHDEMHVHLVNMIRLAWDDLKNLAAKEFPLYVPPRKNSNAAADAAEKVENICYGYNTAGRKRGGLDMKALMHPLTWDLVGLAESVAMVYPDYKRKTPFFGRKDPRTHFPIGWSPWGEGTLENTLFAYKTSLSELKLRFPDKATELNRHRTTYLGYEREDDDIEVWMGEFYAVDAWYVATLEDRPVILVGSESGDRGHPGIQPVVHFQLPSGPRSPFADQVSLQAAMSRMFSQKIEFFDQTLYPMIFHTPLATGNTIRRGPNASNLLDITGGTQPKVEVVAPQNPVDADETMGFVMGLQRMLNRNPESRQGIGEADSAKAINELMKGINSTVQDGIWPSFLVGLPKLYQAAAQMDLNLWGNTKKSIAGQRIAGAKRRFDTTYVPNLHLKDYVEDIEIEPGLGLAGYQGVLDTMQRLGAKLISCKTALEQLPDYRDPQGEERRIQIDQMEEAMFQDLMAKAGQGVLQPGAFAEIRRQIEKDTNLFDAIEDLEKAGRLIVAPPTEEVAPEGGMPAGMEEMLAGLGGGEMPGGESLPSLEGLRGLPDAQDPGEVLHLQRADAL